MVAMERRKPRRPPFIAASSDAAHRCRIMQEKRGIASSTHPMARNHRGPCPKAGLAAISMDCMHSSAAVEYSCTQDLLSTEKERSAREKKKKGRRRLPNGPRSHLSASKPMTFCVQLSLIPGSFPSSL